MAKEISERVDIVVWAEESFEHDCGQCGGVGEHIPEAIAKAPALKDA